MTKEALKLALEALEAAYERIVTKCEQNLVTYNGVDVDTLTLSQEAITAIKEALMSVPDGAQPEPWEKFCDSNCVWTDHHPDCKLAQRTWVGLTDEEAFQICVDCGCLSADWLTLLDAIEAKLKEKNT